MVIIIPETGRTIKDAVVIVVVVVICAEFLILMQSSRSFIDRKEWKQFCQFRRRGRRRRGWGRGWSERWRWRRRCAHNSAAMGRRDRRGGEKRRRRIGATLGKQFAVDDSGCGCGIQHGGLGGGEEVVEVLTRVLGLEDADARVGGSNFLLHVEHRQNWAENLRSLALRYYRVALLLHHVFDFL